jgi:hypothetical protein
VTKAINTCYDYASSKASGHCFVSNLRIAGQYHSSPPYHFHFVTLRSTTCDPSPSSVPRLDIPTRRTSILRCIYIARIMVPTRYHMLCLQHSCLTGSIITTKLRPAAVDVIYFHRVARHSLKAGDYSVLTPLQGTAGSFLENDDGLQLAAAVSRRIQKSIVSTVKRRRSGRKYGRHSFSERFLSAASCNTYVRLCK